MDQQGVSTTDEICVGMTEGISRCCATVLEEKGKGRGIVGSGWQLDKGPSRRGDENGRRQEPSGPSARGWKVDRDGKRGSRHLSLEVHRFCPPLASCLCCSSGCARGRGRATLLRPSPATACGLPMLLLQVRSVRLASPLWCCRRECSSVSSTRALRRC